jgi:6-phosphogluconate dehydrogenase
MHLGIVGLGRMGGNMRGRMRDKGLEVTGYDPNAEVSDVATLEELAAALPSPRIVWVMVPSGPITTGVITDLAETLSEGDLVIEGGNSKFTDDAKHAELLAAKGIGYVDVGVSGGVWGRENGYGLMAGGNASDIERAMPVFDALRPEGPRDDLIHDVTGVFKAWQRGTVVRSWLLELLVKALEEDPGFEDIAGYVEDSGEGRWAVQEAIQNAVPVPTISASIFARFVSRQDDSPSMKAVAALRKQFGGHAVRPS